MWVLYEKERDIQGQKADKNWIKKLLIMRNAGQEKEVKVA